MILAIALPYNFQFLRAPLVFQMKPVPLGKEKELSGVWPALPPGNTSGYAYGAGGADKGKLLSE